MDTIYHYIISRDDDINFENIYNGSTKNINLRFNKHRQDCNNKHINTKLYKYIRENGTFDRFLMTVYEEQIVFGNDAQRKRQALEREEELRVALGSTLNTNRPIILNETKQEYMRNYCRNYFRNNLEQKEKNKQRVLARYHTLKKK